MAQADDSIGSWPGFLAYLNKTFLLIRDVFGYVVPGGVFLAVGLLSQRFSLRDVHSFLWPYQPPTWAAMALLVAICYPLGHILIAVAYMPIDLMKVFHRKDHKYLANVPTEVTAELLEARARHPGLFVDLDRRETMAILMGGMASALLLGAAVFCRTHAYPFWLFTFLSVLLFINFATSMPHLKRVRDAILNADEGLQAEEATKNLG
jgi:hypothetical protein